MITNIKKKGWHAHLYVFIISFLVIFFAFNAVSINNFQSQDPGSTVALSMVFVFILFIFLAVSSMTNRAFVVSYFLAFIIGAIAGCFANLHFEKVPVILSIIAIVFFVEIDIIFFSPKHKKLDWWDALGYKILSFSEGIFGFLVGVLLYRIIRNFRPDWKAIFMFLGKTVVVIIIVAAIIGFIYLWVEGNRRLMLKGDKK